MTSNLKLEGRRTRCACSVFYFYFWLTTGGGESPPFWCQSPLVHSCFDAKTLPPPWSPPPKVGASPPALSFTSISGPEGDKNSHSCQCQQRTLTTIAAAANTNVEKSDDNSSGCNHQHSKPWWKHQQAAAAAAVLRTMLTAPTSSKWGTFCALVLISFIIFCIFYCS